MWIGPYLFEDILGAALTVNGDGDQYRKLLTYFLWPRMDGTDLTKLWCKKDDAPFHSARETLKLLDEKLEDFVSRGVPFIGTEIAYDLGYDLSRSMIYLNQRR